MYTSICNEVIVIYNVVCCCETIELSCQLRGVKEFFWKRPAPAHRIVETTVLDLDAISHPIFDPATRWDLFSDMHIPRRMRLPIASYHLYTPPTYLFFLSHLCQPFLTTSLGTSERLLYLEPSRGHFHSSSCRATDSARLRMIERRGIGPIDSRSTAMPAVG